MTILAAFKMAKAKASKEGSWTGVYIVADQWLIFTARRTYSYPRG